MTEAGPSIRRIEVDAESAWLQIRGNMEKSMTENMEARLGTLPGGATGSAARAVRKEVEARLARTNESVIYTVDYPWDMTQKGDGPSLPYSLILPIREDMFTLAKPNVRINGQHYETFVEATEPWDEALDHRMWSLATEKESYMDEVAVLRKTLPQQVQAVDMDLERRRTNMEWLPEGEDDDEGKDKRPIPPPARQAEVRASFESAISNVSELVQTAPVQLQRAQRAQTVREEVASLPK